MNLSALRVVISADPGPLTKGLDKAASDMQRFAAKMSNMGRTLSTGITAPIVAASGAMAVLANNTAAQADRIDKMSQRLGMSREAFQKWDFVLSQNGVSIDSLGNGMKSLAQHMDAAARKGGESAGMFRSLGVAVTDSSGAFRSQEDVFTETIRSLQGMGEGIEKAALAQKLFGRNGQELLPMLNASKGSMDDLMRTAEDLGLVLSDTAIDAGVRFTDSMDRLKRQAGAVATTFGATLLPVLERDLIPVIATKILPALRSMAERMGRVVEVWGALPGPLKAVSAGLVAAAAAAGPMLLALSTMPGILARVSAGFRVLSVAMLGPWGIAAAAVVGVVVAIRKDFLGLGTLVRGVWERIGDTVRTVMDATVRIVKMAANFQIGAWVGLLNAAREVWGHMVRDYGGTINSIIGFAGQAVEAYGRLIRWQWEQTSRLFAFVQRLVGRSAEQIRERLMEAETLAGAVGRAFLDAFEVDYVGRALDGVIGKMREVGEATKDALSGLGIDGAGAGVGAGLAAVGDRLREHVTLLARGHELRVLSGAETVEAFRLETALREQLRAGNLALAERVRLQEKINQLQSIGNAVATPVAPAAPAGLMGISDTLRSTFTEPLEREVSRFTSLVADVRTSVADDLKKAGEMFLQAGAEIVGHFGPAGVAASFLGGVLDGLRPFLERLHEPLRILGTVLGSLLVPVLKITFPVFKAVAIAATYIGEVFARVAQAILNAVGGLVKGLGQFINRLVPFVNPGDPLVKAGEALQDTAASYGQAARELSDARKEIRALKWEDALDPLHEAVANVAQAMNNVPQIFDHTFRRLQAARGTGPISVATPPGPLSFPTGDRPPDVRFTFESGAIVVSGASDPRAVAEEVIRGMVRKLNRGGDTELTVALRAAVA